LFFFVFFFPFSPAMKDSFPPLVHLFLSFKEKRVISTIIHVAHWVFFLLLLYSPEASCVHLFHCQPRRRVPCCVQEAKKSLRVSSSSSSCPLLAHFLFFYKPLRAFHFYFKFFFLSKR
jgi:hypothetical protein